MTYEITCSLMGGMGNIMYMVANSFALSKKYNLILKFYPKNFIYSETIRKNIDKYYIFSKFILKSLL